MELFLNLAGLLVAVALVGLWLRYAPREGFDRRTQIIALAVLILILFPVISVTDDLLAAQSPAETDSCARTDHATLHGHSASPVSCLLPEPFQSADALGSLRFSIPGTLRQFPKASPALAPIENRPPPTA